MMNGGTTLNLGLSCDDQMPADRVRRPAPCFGEHNEDVLVGELRISASECADLVRRRIIADVPTAAL